MQLTTPYQSANINYAIETSPTVVCITLGNVLVLVLVRGHVVSSDDLLLATDDFRHNYYVHEATYLSHATVLRAINCSVFYVGL